MTKTIHICKWTSFAILTFVIVEEMASKWHKTTLCSLKQEEFEKSLQNGFCFLCMFVVISFCQNSQALLLLPTKKIQIILRYFQSSLCTFKPVQASSIKSLNLQYCLLAGKEAQVHAVGSNSVETTYILFELPYGLQPFSNFKHLFSIQFLFPFSCKQYYTLYIL